jgi:hypothetical protein
VIGLGILVVRRHLPESPRWRVRTWVRPRWSLFSAPLRGGALTTTSFMALLLASFFLASAGASSAYLTVSEVLPLEIRGLAIALFYAVGTAVGGITGPLLFGNFIHSGDHGLIALGFFIGAAAIPRRAGRAGVRGARRG